MCDRGEKNDQAKSDMGKWRLSRERRSFRGLVFMEVVSRGCMCGEFVATVSSL